jgi:hypothetical protein
MEAISDALKIIDELLGRVVQQQPTPAEGATLAVPTPLICACGSSGQSSILRERVAQPVGLLLDVVEAVAVFDGGAVREPVAHADAVRVADMVRVPEGHWAVSKRPLMLSRAAPIRAPARGAAGMPVRRATSPPAMPARP